MTDTLIKILAAVLVLQIGAMVIVAGAWRWGEGARSGLSFRNWFAGRIAPWAALARYRTFLKWAAGQKVTGYVDRHSIRPGEHFNLMLSTTPAVGRLSGHVEVFRVGRSASSDRELAGRSGELTVRYQASGWSSPNTGAAWHPSTHGLTTEGWRSGYYTIDFVARDGYRERDVAFVVVRARQAEGDILVKLSTNTYQAYNKWGGSSLYKSLFDGIEPATVVSFDRPTRSQFCRWEYYYVMWLEEFAASRGLSVHYATNYDFHADSAIADGYRLVVSVGHDEYWSQQEFDVFYRRIFDQGKNVMFLGGNTAYWRVRYADLGLTGTTVPRGRLMVCYKNTLKFEREGTGYCDQARLNPDESGDRTGLFRGAIGCPEIDLMGVQWSLDTSEDVDTDLNDENKFDYRVKTAPAWLVKDTGLQEGMVVGPVVGYEWDNAGEGAEAERIAKVPRRHGTHPLPREKVVVLFEGRPVSRTGQPSHAEAIFFESETGGRVFSASTIRWVLGLGKPGYENPAFRKLNENLHEYFLEPAARDGEIRDQRG